VRALALALLTAGCSFNSSGGSGPDGTGAGDAGGTPTADSGPGPADAGGSPDATSSPRCEAPWVLEPTGCHQYVKDMSLSFDAAEEDCASRAGHLVVEDAVDEYVAVAAGMAPLSELDRFWIGLHDPAPDDNVFVWVTGEPLLDPHWAGAEPSNSGDCANARADGTWGDRTCSEPKMYVCEKND